MNIDFEPDFKSLEISELTKLTELLNLLSQGPFTSVVKGEQVIIYDKNGQMIMAFGKDWLEHI